MSPESTPAAATPRRPAGSTAPSSAGSAPSGAMPGSTTLAVSPANPDTTNSAADTAPAATTPRRLAAPSRPSSKLRT